MRMMSMLLRLVEVARPVDNDDGPALDAAGVVDVGVDAAGEEVALLWEGRRRPMLRGCSMTGGSLCLSGVARRSDVVG